MTSVKVCFFQRIAEAQWNLWIWYNAGIGADDRLITRITPQLIVPRTSQNWMTLLIMFDGRNWQGKMVHNSLSTSLWTLLSNSSSYYSCSSVLIAVRRRSSTAAGTRVIVTIRVSRLTGHNTWSPALREKTRQKQTMQRSVAKDGINTNITHKLQVHNGHASTLRST